MLALQCNARTCRQGILLVIQLRSVYAVLTIESIVLGGHSDIGSGCARSQGIAAATRPYVGLAASDKEIAVSVNDAILEEPLPMTFGRTTKRPW